MSLGVFGTILAVAGILGVLFLALLGVCCVLLGAASDRRGR